MAKGSEAEGEIPDARERKMCLLVVEDDENISTAIRACRLPCTTGPTRSCSI
jgi:hypothetical protein